MKRLQEEKVTKAHLSSVFCPLVPTAEHTQAVPASAVTSRCERGSRGLCLHVRRSLERTPLLLCRLPYLQVAYLRVCVCLWRGAATWKWQEQHHHTQTSFKPLELMFFISVKLDGLVILSVCCWASSVEFFYWNWLHIVTFFIAIFDLKGADISF